MEVSEARIALGGDARPQVRVFLSVATVDSHLWEPLTDRLYRTLSLVPNYDFAPFDMRRILPSEDPMEVIAGELEGYHLGVGLLSTGFFASSTIRNIELRTFVHRDDARFVPVLLEPLPQFVAQLPEIAGRQIYGFNEPWNTLSPSSHARWVNTLVERILEVLEKYGDKL